MFLLIGVMTLRIDAHSTAAAMTVDLDAMAFFAEEVQHSAARLPYSYQALIV